MKDDHGVALSEYFKLTSGSMRDQCSPSNKYNAVSCTLATVTHAVIIWFEDLRIAGLVMSKLVEAYMKQLFVFD